jgi:DNA polymerase
VSEEAEVSLDAQRQLAQLALSWAGCTSCGLCTMRSRVVFHRGNPSGSIAIVGDAPGREEDARGLPFVGPAGKLLDEMLAAAKVSFDDVCYLNLIGCRTPYDRAPNREEIGPCLARTLGMLRAIDPAVVIMLGLTAANTLAHVTSVGPWRGMPVEVELDRGRSCRGIVTYHPRFLLQHSGHRLAALRRNMLSDLKVARALASTRKDSRDLLGH